MVKITYKTGDKVFAKVKGYPPWPARIVGDTGKKKYNVLFYGTEETGAIKAEDIAYYLKYKDSYIHKYLKRPYYGDAVKQIEEAIKNDGGDGSEGASFDDSSRDLDMSDASSVSSISDKKTPKTKTLSEDTPVKKTPVRGRRKSGASTESKEDISEEPAPKKPRRESKRLTESKPDEEISEKDKTSTDNGIKEDAPEEPKNDVAEKAEQKLEIDTESKTVESKKEEEAVPENKKTEDSSAVKVEDVPNDQNQSEVEKEKVVKDNDKAIVKENGADIQGKKENQELKTSAVAEEISQVEEEPKVEPARETKKTVKKVPVKVEIVTEQLLNNNILYADYVKKHADLFKDKPVEERKASQNDVLPVKLPSGTICGIKLHKEWPLNRSTEQERALYDEKVSKLALEVKELLTSGKKNPDEVEADVIPDIQMTLEDIKEIAYARDIESKRRRLERLKKEAELVTWDSKIKNNLGLDKALPDLALEALKEFTKVEKNLDALMFKKHPHVLDTVRRLRKYVGNTREWDMVEEDAEIFSDKAAKIRNEAEKIYNKVKNVVKIDEDSGTFWDSFMELVGEFRTKCKDMTEAEILVLCAEPDSRQAFLDKLDESIVESEGTNINKSNTSEPVLKETSVQGWSEKKEK